MKLTPLLKRVATAMKKDAQGAASFLHDYTHANKDRWQRNLKEAAAQGARVVKASAKSAAESATSLYRSVCYSKEGFHDLQNQIEAQGGYYRELVKSARSRDMLTVGGQSLAALLSAPSVPDEIENAFRAAYPDLAQSVSFGDRVRSLEGAELQGLISGVKGKLFEQRYVEYLNDGNLPEGYVASLAGRSNQPGWDIQIVGPDQEIVSVLQAKATDSVSYVSDAIEQYPNIDVVTTDEVYSHLVMSGVSESIVSSGVSNAALADELDGAAEAAELSVNFAPPLLTLALIAFTSYKDGSLRCYDVARRAGERYGQAYLASLVAGTVAAITNTWWLGVLASVASRHMSDHGRTKGELFFRLRRTYEANQAIIDKLKRMREV